METEYQEKEITTLYGETIVVTEFDTVEIEGLFVEIWWLGTKINFPLIIWEKLVYFLFI